MSEMFQQKQKITDPKYFQNFAEPHSFTMKFGKKEIAGKEISGIWINVPLYGESERYWEKRSKKGRLKSVIKVYGYPISCVYFKDEIRLFERTK